MEYEQMIMQQRLPVSVRGLRGLVFALLSGVALMACADAEKESDAECLASGSVTIIDAKKVGDRTYYLIHRVTGLHEKIESFELYNAEPNFDSCGKSDIGALFGDSLENKDFDNRDQHIRHIYLVLPDKLDIEYGPGALPRLDYNKSLSLELRQDS